MLTGTPAPDATLSAGGTWATFGVSGTSLIVGAALTWCITDDAFTFKMPSFPTTSSAPSIELRNAAGVQWRLFRGASGWTAR